MKVAFLTNIPSYYQTQLANSFMDTLGCDNFKIIFHRPLSNSRIEMGWKDDYINNSVIKFWASEIEKQCALEWINDADVVIQGRFPIHYVRKRIDDGKLTFAYQERLWKTSFYRIDTLWRIFSLYKNYWSVNRPNYHFLAAGAYASNDVAKISCFKNRRWKFGYFIDEIKSPVKNKNKTAINLLWCGKLVNWKQPKTAIQIAHRLQQENINFSLTIIGDGPERAAIEEEIKLKNLGSNIELLGWQNHNEIILEMQKADLFLMTSNRKEGWGVVINEAISQGCCVIANTEAGAAPWLIDDTQTGFLYTDKNLELIIQTIIRLSTFIEQCHYIGRQANNNLNTIWSTKVAANRLIILSDGLLKGQPMEGYFQQGPCSIA